MIVRRKIRLFEVTASAGPSRVSLEQVARLWQVHSKVIPTPGRIVCSALGQNSCGMPTTTPQTMAKTWGEASHLLPCYPYPFLTIPPKAIACEVLARRIVHQAPPDRLTCIMSTRFKHRQIDGDDSDMSSALELAIDSRWCVFTALIGSVTATVIIARYSCLRQRHRTVSSSNDVFSNTS